MFLLAVLSGCALFLPEWLIGVMGIQEAIFKYRPWIVVIFSITSGLQVLGLGLFVAGWFRRLILRKHENWKYSRLDLSVEARIALKLLEKHLPDPVQLEAAKPAIRELRRHGLIEGGFFFPGEDIRSFSLTVQGKIAARAVVESEFDLLTTEQKRALILDLTGANHPSRGPHGWMTR